MQTRIPLPTLNNDAFKDVMDYFEQIQKRKALAQQAEKELAQKEKQFGQTFEQGRTEFAENKALEREKMAELAKYHQQQLAKQSTLDPLRAELLRARIEQARSKGEEVKLSPQEKTQSMKLLEAGRSLKSVVERAHGIDALLEENPSLTGYKAGFKSLLNKPGKKVSELIEKSGNLQSAIGRLASQRGGAAVLKWAEKVKPSVWKDVESNKGMTKSIIEDTMNDFQEAKDEYESLTGKSYPIKMPKMKSTSASTGKMVKVRDKETGEVKEMTLEEAQKLMAGG